jgi:translation initiation factor IF-3
MYTVLCNSKKSERKLEIAESEYRINNQIRAKEVRLIIEEDDAEVILFHAMSGL